MSGGAPCKLREGRASDREAILALVAADTFAPGDVEVAMELVDAAIAGSRDYLVRVAAEVDTDVVLGYVCFGPTPMTESTYDLYWLCTAAAARGRGIGGALVGAMERELASRGGRRVRVETSVEEAYGAARSFYERHRYLEAGRITDFYKPGDDLLILCKQLPGS